MMDVQTGKPCRPFLAAALGLALAAVSPLSALEKPEYLRTTWGVLLESFLDPALTTKGNSVRTSPLSINFNLGAGVSMPLSEGSPWAFAPSGDIYFYNAEYSNDGQPVVTDDAFSSAFVMGLILNVPIVYSLPLSDSYTISAGLGLCFDLRAAFTRDSSYEADNTKRMNAYFWGMGRFFTPSTTLRFEYKLTDRVGFGMVGRALWPIYNLWTDEGYGFLDQGKYFVDLVIRYKLKSASEPLAPAEVSPTPTSP